MNRMIGSTADAEGIPLSSFQRASMLEGMDRAEAVDDAIVKVTMARPNSAFFNGLTENRMPMMPREMVDVGFDDPLKMAGVGAFQMDEFVDGAKMTYKKVPNYFRANEPYFDKFEQLVIPDRSATITAFISGQVQSIGALQNHELTTLKAAKPDANYYTWVDSNWMHFRPNMSYAPFADFRVRKAMMLATDHAALGDGYWGEGWGYQAALHPGFPEAWKSDKVKTLPGYNPETKEADRAEAVKMMEAAGYANGAGIEFETLYVEVIGDTKENAIRFQEQMMQVFPEMKVTVKGYPDLASYSKPQAESDFRGVSYIITATPDIVLEAISQFHSKGSRNYGKFSEPVLDDILDRAQVELDGNARTQLMDEFQTKFMEEWQPLIVFYARPARTMLQGDIGGFDTTAGTWFGYGGLTKIPRWYYVA
jgi:peptide/nickel transport system substrate-binding protein